MGNRLLIMALVAACCGSPAVADPLPASDDQPAVATFLASYCVDCHGAETQQGERRFDRLDLADLDDDGLFDLQDIIDQLTLGSMPPDDSAQPSDEQRQAVIDALTGALAAARASRDSTGRQTVLRRLNRREYLHTVADLFDIDVSMFDPTTSFPGDDTADHFDNIGDVLVTSGYLLEEYLHAAQQIVDKVFAIDQQPEEQQWTFRGDFRQQPELNKAHQEAFDYRYLCLYDCPQAERPEGAYGPLLKFPEGVPVDGRYEIRVRAQAMHRDTPYDAADLRIDLSEPLRLGIVPGNAAVGEMHRMQPIQPLLAEAPIDDGKPRWYSFEVPLDRGHSPRFTFPNGMVEVRPTYGRIVRKYRELLPEELQDASGIVQNRKALIKAGFLPHIRIHEVRIRGPIGTAASLRSQQAVLGDEPFAPQRTEALLRRFAHRAYRRPPRQDEIARLMALVEARQAGGPAPLEAFQDGLKAILCSPAFLYLEPGTVEAEADEEAAVLSAHGLASRLSYFLWASTPDQPLLEAADSGQLHQHAVLLSHARRLLDDPRSDRMIAGLLDSWLGLRQLGEMPPDRAAFEVYYAAGLESDMRTETQLFTRHLIDENRPALEFLAADYSFLNRDLAKLYDVVDRVDAEGGHRFRRVTFDSPRRGGLLGQASVLTVTSNGIETSPVTRGVWILENILGTPPAPPPDDVPAIDPDVRGATSIRDLLEKHRSTAACNQCHRRIDPLGFALEAFDPIGRQRERYENKSPVDTSGQLPGGEPFADIAELKSMLLERRQFFARMLTERLLAYSLGRRVEPADREQVERIMASVEGDGYPLRSLIEQVVLSEVFRQP